MTSPSLLDRIRVATTWLRVAPMPPDPVLVYKQALRDYSIPRKEVAGWHRAALVAEEELPADRVAGFRNVGFAPAEAESWFAQYPHSCPTPKTAYGLHLKGWTGWDFAFVRRSFPHAGSGGVMVNGQLDLTEGRVQQEVLMEWFACPLPGWAVADYVWAGITLSEAVDTWEPLRTENPEQWEANVEFLHAFQDAP